MELLIAFAYRFGKLLGQLFYRQQVVQDVEWKSFAKGFAASLINLHMAPFTNFKHCGLVQCVWLAVALAAYFYIQDRFNGNACACCNVYSCWCPDLYTSVSHCYRFCALRAIAGHFGEVQPGFLQLLLTQTWVKCTSLDSSRCVVYSGIRVKAI